MKTLLVLFLSVLALAPLSVARAQSPATAKAALSVPVKAAVPYAGFSAFGVGISKAPWDVLHQLAPIPASRDSKNALHYASAPPDPWIDCSGIVPSCTQCGWNLLCYFYCC